MSDAYVALGVRNPAGRHEQLLQRFDHLIGTIEGEGLPVCLIGNSQSKDVMAPPDEYVWSSQPQDPFRTSVVAMRDFTGRLTGVDAPTLNEPPVTELVFDKLRLNKLLGSNAAGGILVEAGHDPGDFCDFSEAAAFIVRLARGNDTEIEIISRDSLAGRYYDQPMLVQEFWDTSHLPAGIQAAGDYYQDMLRLPAAKELRLYAFRRHDASTNIVAAVRVSDDPLIMSHGQFAIIDQDTVPEAARNLALRATDLIAAETDVPYLHAAVDIAFDADDEQPWVVDVKAKEPDIPSYRQVIDGEDDMSRSARQSLHKQVYGLLGRQLVYLTACERMP